MAESTPRKFFKFIQFTPNTKKILCLLCGNKIEKSDYRRKLFHGTLKTEYCILVEKYLDIIVTEDTHTDTACRKCIRELQKIDSTVISFKKTYQSSISKLQETHGSECVSFKRQSTDEGTASRRRALFSNDGAEENVNVLEENTNIKVTLTGSVKEKVFEVKRSYLEIVEALAGDEIDKVGSLVLAYPELQDNLKLKVCKIIQEEIRLLSLKSSNSVLRKTNYENLESFSIQSVLSEWNTRAPTFHQLLLACISNPSHQRNKHKRDETILPGLVSAGSKLLSLYNQELNLFQHLNSVILYKGGCKKSAFARLNSTNDCLSYRATLNIADKFGYKWADDLTEWKDDVVDGARVEGQLINEITMVKESMDLLRADPEVNIDLIFQLSNLEQELELHRKMMHPGFYFVGDNVDMRTSVRHMTLLNQSKDHHMYQICAYINRVSGNHLQNVKPKDDIQTVPFSLVMPSITDRDQLKEEFTFLVAKVWTQHIPHFHVYAQVLPKIIEHPYLKEMKQKTERINVGVLMKSEQYNEDMTDICEFVHKYVPGHDETDDWNKHPIKTLSGGDYLTFERHKVAQSSKRNGRTPSKRLEGLIPKMEEFHNQGELLQVIWKLLYSTSSSKDDGTLFASRNLVNARNVTKEPNDNFYASSDLVEKTTFSYIIAGALQIFGMDTIDSQPTLNMYEGTIGDSTEMRTYILKLAKTFVESYCMPDLPVLPNYGPQSLNLECRYCNKKYKKGAALRRHEATVHDHDDPRFAKPNQQTSPTVSSSTTDGIYNYTRLFLTLGLLRLDHNDAIHMGDGERIMRVNNFLYLYYKSTHCTKYAFGMLETICQSKFLLTDRQAHRLIWNRTVNHKGALESNHPNDLDIEHCNKVFKDQAHSYRGVFTEKTVSRVSRSALKVNEVVKHYDKLCNVSISSGEHKDAKIENDIRTLVQTFKNKKLFDIIPGRSHTAFPNMTNDPLSELDMDHVKDWIEKSFKALLSKMICEHIFSTLICFYYNSSSELYTMFGFLLISSISLSLESSEVVASSSSLYLSMTSKISGNCSLQSLSQKHSF